MKNIHNKYSDLIRFHFFSSSESDELLGQYYEGQQRALERYQISGIKVPFAIENQKKSEAIIVLAFDQLHGKMVGGIRIERKSNEFKLPIEKSRIPYVESFCKNVEQYFSRGQSVVEICGLWADSQQIPQLKSISLGSELCFQAVQHCLRQGYNVLTAVVPPHTLVHMSQLGFVTDEKIHQVPYPDERYLSSVIWYFNPQPQINPNLLKPFKNNEVISYEA